jgi:transcription elongation factor Elf1
MNLKCPNCETKCEYELLQKIASKDCELKIHFNIMELVCGSCENKFMISNKPKK